jgi:hypothetical protein
MKTCSSEKLIANYSGTLIMTYRSSRTYPKPKLYNYLARGILAVGIVAIAGYFLQYREIICQPRVSNVVICQNHYRHFLWLNLTGYLPFQLQSVEVTPYRASRSNGESREYYTAYQLDISGVQADGQVQYITMKSYDENQDKAYADLGEILDLRSGASREALTLGEINCSGLVVFLSIICFIDYRFGLWRYLTRPIRQTQEPVAQVAQTAAPIRCRPATTWTETDAEDRPNPSPKPVSRRIDSLYSKSNRLN